MHQDSASNISFETVVEYGIAILVISSLAAEIVGINLPWTRKVTLITFNAILRYSIPV